jgi:hypothetical protein
MITPSPSKKTEMKENNLLETVGFFIRLWTGLRKVLPLDLMIKIMMIKIKNIKNF